MHTILPINNGTSGFSPMVGQSGLLTYHKQQPGCFSFNPKLAISDAQDSPQSETKFYPFKAKACSGYISHSVPGVKGAVFIPIQLKIAITAVSSSMMLESSQETSAVQQVDALYRKRIKNNEFLLIHEDGRPTSLIGKMGEGWITQSMREEESGNIVSPKNLVVVPTFSLPPPNTINIGRVFQHDITKAPGKNSCYGLVYAPKDFVSLPDPDSRRSPKIYPQPSIQKCETYDPVADLDDRVVLERDL